MNNSSLEERKRSLPINEEKSGKGETNQEKRRTVQKKYSPWSTISERVENRSSTGLKQKRRVRGSASQKGEKRPKKKKVAGKKKVG